MKPSGWKKIVDKTDHYVYTLIDPRDGQPFYVGMSSKTAKRNRIKHHVQLAQRGIASNKNQRLFDRITDILSGNHSVQHNIVRENLTLSEAESLEKETITFYGLDVLTNLNYGGSSFIKGTYVATEETRQKISTGLMGRKYTAEHCRNIGKAKLGNTYMLGKTMSVEARKKISDKATGRVNLKTRKTYTGFISPDGTVYKNVVGLTEFCKQHGLRQSLMSAVIAGRQTSHKGWRMYGSKHTTNP